MSKYSLSDNKKLLSNKQREDGGGYHSIYNSSHYDLSYLNSYLRIASGKVDKIPSGYLEGFDLSSWKDVYKDWRKNQIADRLDKTLGAFINGK